MYNPRESDTGSETSTDDAYDLACDVGFNALVDNNLRLWDDKPVRTPTSCNVDQQFSMLF